VNNQEVAVPELPTATTGETDTVIAALAPSTTTQARGRQTGER
jgi:hypothetical protein